MNEFAGTGRRIRSLRYSRQYEEYDAERYLSGRADEPVADGGED
jgi:hypothetical protein